MNRKYSALLLIMALFLAMLSGCGQKTPEQKQEPPEKELQGKWIRHNSGQEPETIDPTLNTTVNGGTVILAVFEGLTKLDKNDNPVGGAAEKCEVSKDLKTYTFTLRKDAKWSDGQPVTAGDFYYSWKRALTPATAAEYSYMFYYIKNAERFNTDETGKMRFEEVGIKVKDDHTLEVTLENPTPFFLKLTAFPAYMPLRQDLIEKYAEKWTASPESYIGNGPFKMAEWKSKDSIKLVKNPHYWAASDVKIDGVLETFIAEASTMLSAYQAGDLDIIDSVPLDEIARLKEEAKDFYILPQLATEYYSFNVKKPPFNNPKVRKALALAIDREDIVNKVRKTGYPATGFVPPGVPDAKPGQDFRTIGGHFFPIKANTEEAKKLLAEAGYADPGKFPAVTLLYNTDEGHKKIAEAILEMWKTNLGITSITLQNQEGAVLLNTLQNGDYQISRMCWYADYNDPMSFIDIFTSGNGNNFTQWGNREFDRLIRQSRLAAGEDERMEILHKAEKIFLDETIIIPIFHNTENTMIRPNIKDLHKSPLGFTFFDKADIVK